MRMYKAVPQDENCVLPDKGVHYTGRLNVTWSGHSCQRWAVDEPHVKSERASSPTNFPEKDLQKAKNYCRNPDNELCIWCYTTDPYIRFEYCKKRCSLPDRGIYYTGKHNVTRTGRTCQRWAVDEPHRKVGEASSPSNFPEKDFQKAKNYCRNPDNGACIWCYTTDPDRRFEYCNVLPQGNGGLQILTEKETG
ncbi:plasminogen-like [Tubulanus polymorphus]|uniref:plasminogen-like n=1 Tax=Tubulanus polymorphus TaxID=672921 RepID=UPI003DA37E1E